MRKTSQFQNDVRETFDKMHINEKTTMLWKQDLVNMAKVSTEGRNQMVANQTTEEVMISNDSKPIKSPKNFFPIFFQ